MWPAGAHPTPDSQVAGEKGEMEAWFGKKTKADPSDIRHEAPESSILPRIRIRNRGYPPAIIEWPLDVSLLQKLQIFMFALSRGATYEKF